MLISMTTIYDLGGEVGVVAILTKILDEPNLDLRTEVA